MNETDSLREITRRASEIIASLPPHVTVVAAAKTRRCAEVQAALAGGIRVIGQNYLQEAETLIQGLRSVPEVRLPDIHMIGHLQRNKASKAAEILDLLETLDALPLAAALDKRCRALGKTLPVLIEINSAREPNKAGVFPEDVERFARSLAPFEMLRVVGLMTLGPWTSDPSEIRPFFRLTQELFERLKACALPHLDLQHLSMGMSDSYQIAIEEGADWVRLGTALFGPRS